MAQHAQAEGTSPRHILVLCTGNSCRSQIAEALINHDLGGAWRAVSAGTQPAGFVHPMAITVLRELGIDAAGLSSKSVDAFRGRPFDVVLTVCDDAAENCPLWQGQGQRLHISFPDPAKVTGSEEQILGAFRTVRDRIRAEVPAALAAPA